MFLESGSIVTLDNFYEPPPKDKELLLYNLLEIWKKCERSVWLSVHCGVFIWQKSKGLPKWKFFGYKKQAQMTQLKPF